MKHTPPLRSAAARLLPPAVFLFAACLPCAGEEPESAEDNPPPVETAATEVPSDSERLAALVVTGELWDAPLERSPSSVTVLDATTLGTAGARHLGDHVDAIPNLTWTGGTSRPRYFQLRGIGENSQYEGETPDSTVRFVVDDLDFTGLGMVGSTFDVAQVEVLRGPQAGAYGANAAGGMIRMVTQAPTPYWTGSMEATAGQDSLFGAGFALGGPLLQRDPEEWMFRFAMEHSRSDGFRRNVTLQEDSNARDEWMARLRSVWNASPDLEIDASVFFARQDNGFDEFALDNNGRYTFSDEPGRDEQDSLAGSLRATWHGWDVARLRSITSFGNVDSLYSYDDDWTSAADPAASYQGFSELARDRQSVQQEFRLDSVEEETQGPAGLQRWTLGAHYARVDEDSFYTNRNPSRVQSLATTYASDQFALFGQAARELDASSRLILGLRGESVDMSGRGDFGDSRPGRPPRAVAASYDDLLFGGKLTYERDLAEETLLFASLTRGYKSGGINNDARISPATGDPLTYDTETLWNAEIGLRGQAFQGRLDASLTAFYTDRHDTQVRDSAGFGGSYRFFTDNGGRSHVYGLESEAGWDLGGDWSLHGTLALMESSIDPFTLSNGNTGGGGRLANTPSHGYSLGLRHDPQEGFFGALELVGKAAYLESNSHNEKREAFHVLNASIGWRKDGWSCTLWARNLLDEAYDKRVFFFGNEGPAFTPQRYSSRADPRQIGVTVRYDF